MTSKPSLTSRLSSLIISHPSKSTQDGSIKDYLMSKLRRGAVVRYETYIILGHIFKEKLVTEPIICSHCRDLIYFPFGQICKNCKLSSHTKCLESIKSNCIVGCKDGKLSIEDKPTKRPSHIFEGKTFWFPTHCNHCGIILKGVYQQGLECDKSKKGCGMTVHKDCKDLVCYDCCGRDKTIKSSSKDTVTKVDSERWSKLDASDFELIRLLGTGSFSKVYMAKFKRNEQIYAIKVTNKTNMMIMNNPENSKTEMNILMLTRGHPFIIKGHCCFQNSNKLFHVMEYVKGQDLFYHLERNGRFSEEMAKFYAAEIVLALLFLHKHKVIYRDLKLDNVMLDPEGHCKLLDFGMSKKFEEFGETTQTFCGTPSYISPEVIRQSSYSFSVDWWSLGVLCFEMLAGYSPFSSDNDEELYKMILEDDIKLPKFLSEEAKSLLVGLLTKDVHNRLGCQILEDGPEEVLRHPFFIFKSWTCDGTIENQWIALEQRKITPPRIGTVQDIDTRKLSGIHWNDILKLSASDKEHIAKIPQSEFEDFSFYSESFEKLAK